MLPVNSLLYICMIFTVIYNVCRKYRRIRKIYRYLTPCGWVVLLELEWTKNKRNVIVRYTCSLGTCSHCVDITSSPRTNGVTGTCSPCFTTCDCLSSLVHLHCDVMITTSTTKTWSIQHILCIWCYYVLLYFVILQYVCNLFVDRHSFMYP